MSDENEITEEERRSFTSWKLTIIDALSCDVDVSDIGFRVAFRLMQHVNLKTRQAHPSIDRIAAQVGASRHTVMRALNQLCDPEGAHWIDRHRENRQKPYFYSFREERVNQVLDCKILREDDARDEMNERKKNASEVANLQHRDSPEVANLQHRDVANLLTPDVAPVQPEHLTQNYLNGTPDKISGDEGETIELTRETADPGEVPFDPPESIEAGKIWLRQAEVSPGHFEEALRLLMRGKLKSSHVTEWDREDARKARGAA